VKTQGDPKLESKIIPYLKKMQRRANLKVVLEVPENSGTFNTVCSAG